MEKENDVKMEISQEVAENDFLQWCENVGIEVEEFSAKQQETFEPLKKKVVKVCQKGQLVFDGNTAIYTISRFSPETSRGREIKISPPNGRGFMALANGDKNEKALFEFYSNCTGQDVGFFMNLSFKDLQVFNAFAVFFNAI